MTPNELIDRLGSGSFASNLESALTAVSEEVVASGKKGAVTVTFDITPTHEGDIAVIIMESLTRKPPKRAGMGTMAYVGDGELHRQDPRQPEMTFRMVDSTTGEIIEAADVAGTTRELAE